MTRPDLEARRRDWPVAVGVILYLLTGLFPYALSSLLVPPIGLLGLWALWVVGLVVTFSLRRWSRWLPMLGAPLSLLVWAGYLTLGDVLLGWTA
jgi:hypothetical protein